MRAEEEVRLRMGHLFNHVNGTLPNIGFDGLSKQMDRHAISAGFTPQRLLEVFASILEQERETLIAQTVDSVTSARQSRRSWRSRLQSLALESEEELEPLYARQSELRNHVHQLSSFRFDAAWKHKRAHARTVARCDRFRSFFTGELDSIQGLSHSLKALSDLLDQTRRSEIE
jgi:hypothetical protein